MSKLILLFTASLIMNIVNNEPVPYRECYETDENECVVTELRLHPCEKASSGKICKLQADRIIDIEFDFVPNFDTGSLKQKIFSIFNNQLQADFYQIERDGCVYTECPLKKGQKRTYKAAFSLSSTFAPAEQFNLWWKLIEGKNETHVCCVIFFFDLYS